MQQDNLGTQIAALVQKSTSSSLLLPKVLQFTYCHWWVEVTLVHWNCGFRGHWEDDGRSTPLLKRLLL